MILAGDIGGTKTVLALFSESDGPHRPLATQRYTSGEYARLEEIVADFLTEHQVLPEVASFGIAGPVRNNRVRVTNLPWQVDADSLGRVMGDVPVQLLNDLEAIANAIPMLERSDLVSIKKGQTEAEGPIAVVAPGTGLGEAYLFWDGVRYRPIASEGGHTDFAPATPLELELLEYLQPRLGHVSYERVCSGIGIPNLYAFFRDAKGYPEPQWLRRALAEEDDATPVIVKSAQEKGTEICVATLRLFVSILGSEAGNLVLQVVATGGVFLAGGIPPRILPELKSETFFEAFTRKGRFTDLLERVPVWVVINRQVALFGAANHGLAMAGGN